MDHSKNAGWNRDILTQRHDTKFQKTETKDLTDAEFHLTVGRIIRYRLCRGQNVKGYADQVNMAVDECRKAQVYAESSPGLIFRALVEDWSWGQIQKELRQGKKSQQGG